MGPRRMWVSGPDENDDKESSDRKISNSLFGIDEHEPENRFWKIRRIEFNRATTVRRAFEEFFAYLEIRQSLGTGVPS